MTVSEQSLAFLFPGQGSQSIGMLADLAEEFQEVGNTFQEASDALGYDLFELVSKGPVERLNETEYTQPAMLAAGVSVWRVWQKVSDVRPAFMAGHSLGEYTALVCAESLSFRDAIGLVRERAKLMQQAVPVGVGAMAAIIGLEDDAVVGACEKASKDEEKASPANFNAPGQVVIAGHAEAVSRAIEHAKAAGARRCVLLPVSVPSHCALMSEAALRFRESLAAVPFVSPQCRIIHNVDVLEHVDADGIRTSLEKQLSGSVKWTETVLRFSGLGVNRFFECGPGPVLAGLNKRIVSEALTLGLSDPSMLKKAKELWA